MNYRYLIFLSQFLIASYSFEIKSQCVGLDADAGPDMIICDISQIIQLQGSIQGNYTKFMWTPSNNLSSPSVLDPLVTTRVPGKYTFKLTAEGVSTTNLITNGDFESGNTGFSSNYTYNFTNTTEGEYFVTNNPSSWNGGFAPCGDHTSGGGNMLLLNGHPSAGTNFWCQTIPTVAGRMYLFEFWHTSVVSSNPGQLNIKINGMSVGGVQAASLCNWERFEYCFTATSGSTQICMSEASGIRGGNDFAVDDVALFEKCTDMDEVIVEIIDLKAKIDILKKPKCSSEPFDLTALGSSTGPNIRYEWSTDVGRILSQNGLTAKARGSGIYTVKVIYTNGNVTCEQEASIEFIAPDELVGSVVANGKINCRGDSISIDVDMASGSGDYAYKWSPDSSILQGQNTETVLVNKIKKYVVTVTDNNSGCTLIMDVDITADTLKPIAKISGDSLLDCRKTLINLIAGNRDTLRTKLTWITPDQNMIVNKNSISSNQNGIYTLIVQDTVNNCLDSVTKLIETDTIPPMLELGPDLSIDCKKDYAEVTNLIPNLPGFYYYYWEIDNTKLPAENDLNIKTISSKAIVKLRLVNDKNGCEILDSMQILDTRILPIVDAGMDSLLNCNRTVIKLQATFDPKDSVTFLWSTSGGNILTGNNTSSPEINQKGWYYLKVINPQNGCVNLDSVYIDEDKNKPIVILGPDLLFSCKDSLIGIDASAGSTGSNLQFNWSTPDGIIQSGNGSPKINAAAPGSYKLIVTNPVNGCRDSSIVRLNPDLNKPIIAISPADTLTCKKTSINLSATANSSTGNPLDILWTSGTGANISNPLSLNPTINSPGRYTLLVTDATNGCSSIAVIDVEVDTLAPIVDAGKDEIWNCATTSHNLSGNINGNSSQFLFQWSTNGGTINGNPNAQSIQATAPGDYTLRVENLKNGCVSFDQLSVVPDLSKPVVNLPLPDTINCKNNTVLLQSNASGQTLQLSYLWSTVNGNIIGRTDSSFVSVDRMGTYRLTVTDEKNLCTNEANISVIENKVKPVINIQKPQDLNCSRRSIPILANVQNAGANFLVQWTTTNGNLISNPNVLNAEGNAAGIYYLRITNSENGCESLDSVILLENTNLPVDIDFDLQQAKCTGDVAAVNILRVSGGTGPFVYFLDGQIINQLYQSGLNPGLHNLRVVDANGCIFSKDFQILTPSATGVSLPTSVKINAGDPLTLQPVFSIPLDSIEWILWTPSEFLSCSDCPEPNLKGLNVETSFTITYANKQGCTATASILVQIIKRGVWVPNVFSPNGDGINDYFYPVVSEDSYKTVKSMSIYDRWGELVFRKDNFEPNLPSEGWDGKFKNEVLNPAVFLYVLEVEWKNGQTQKLSGDFTLLK